VKWFGKYGRKVGWIVKKIWKIRKKSRLNSNKIWKNMENTEENCEIFPYHFTIQLGFLPYFPCLFTIQLTFLPYFSYLFTIFFHIVQILSLLDLSFFHIFHIISHFNLLFVHYYMENTEET
jgi:hypothetical protein